MAAPSLRDFVLIGVDVLSTAVASATGFITAQLGDVVKQTTRSDGAEWWQHVGFASRPRAPEAGKKAAQVVIFQRGDLDAVIASHDERAAAIVSALADGETAVFASVDGGAVIVFDKNGGATLTSGDVKLGDSSAAALAVGSALSDLIDALVTLAGTNCVNGSTLVGAPDFENTAAQIKTRCQTTKVKAT